MSSRTTRILGAALALGIALLAIFAPTDATGADVPGSVRNVGGDGRRAAAALLVALGHDARVWADAPGALPSSPLPLGSLLWLPQLPELVEDGLISVGDLHDPLGYREFCERGGALVLPADGAETFLVDGLDLRGAVDLESAREDPRTITELALLGGPRLAVELHGVRAWDPLGLPLDVEPILVAPDGAAFAVELRVGSGRVVVLADDGFVGNDRIATADHGLLFVRLVEELGRGRAVRFDEYVLGSWRPETASELAVGPRMFWLTVNVMILALVFTWRHAWVRAFPRDPEALAALSPLARARSVAGLLQRARRFDLLSERLVSGALHRLARKARVRVARTAGSRELLDAIAGNVGASRELPAWRAALFDREVRRASDLERVERTLAAMESHIQSTAGPRPQPRI